METKLKKQNEKLGEQQVTASGLEQDLVLFEGLTSEVETVMVAYSQAFKHKRNRTTGVTST